MREKRKKDLKRCEDCFHCKVCGIRGGVLLLKCSHFPKEGRAYSANTVYGNKYSRNCGFYCGEEE